MQRPQPHGDAHELLEEPIPVWGWLAAWIITAIISGVLMWRFPTGSKFYLGVCALVVGTVAFLISLWLWLEDHVALRIDADGVSQKDRKSVV